MSKLKAIVTVGIPASGKSSFAKTIIDEDPSYVEINRDMVRNELFNIEGWSSYVFSEENEKRVTDRQYEIFRDLHRENKNIIVTDTNLRMKYLRLTVSFLEHLGYEVSIKMCQISFIEAIRRNANRKFSAELDEVRRQHKCYNEMRYKVKTKYYSQLI